VTIFVKISPSTQ